MQNAERLVANLQQSVSGNHVFLVADRFSLDEVAYVPRLNQVTAAAGVLDVWGGGVLV